MAFFSDSKYLWGFTLIGWGEFVFSNMYFACSEHVINIYEDFGGDCKRWERSQRTLTSGTVGLGVAGECGCGLEFGDLQ